MKDCSLLRAAGMLAVMACVHLDQANGKEVATSWMEKLDEGMPLSAVNLPGTHNSGAFNPEPALQAFARCQSCGIRQQLDMGVRFLDIRLAWNESSGALAVCHGKADCLNQAGAILHYAEVLENLSDFLKDNPSETVLLCLCMERPMPEGHKRFLELVRTEHGRAEFKDLFYTEQAVPVMEEARGKILIARRFKLESSEPFGLDFNYWEDNATFSRYKGQFAYRVQDRYQAKAAAKWAAIRELLEDASAQGNKAVLHINFTSANRLLLGTPSSIAVQINRSLQSYAWKTGHYYGWIVMDFVNPELCRNVYSTNFLETNGPQTKKGCP